MTTAVSLPWPTIGDVKGTAGGWRLKASKVGNTDGCARRTAREMRSGLWPDVPGYWPSEDKISNFFLGRIVDAISSVELDGTDESTAVAGAVGPRGKDPALHPLVANYVKHAIVTYLDYSRARKAISGLQATPAVTRIDLFHGDDADVSAWGLWYSDGKTDGTREFRRVRQSRVRPTGKAEELFAVTAAWLLANSDAPGLTSTLRVLEVSLDDSDAHLVWEGTPASAEDRWRTLGYPAATEQAKHFAPRAGWDCRDCDWRAGCPAVASAPGLLGLPRQANRSRHVAASDLDVYERCPARYFARLNYLPKDPTAEETSAQRRGLAVHRWLRAAHCRPAGDPCRTEDTALENDPLGVLDDETWRGVRDLLSKHVPNCLLAFDGLVNLQVEPNIYAFDGEADVLVVNSPDIACTTDDGSPLWRETKTSWGRPVASIETAIERWPQIALGLLMLAAGVPSGSDWFGITAPGQLTVEILHLTEPAQLLVADTFDPSLLSLARRVIAEAAYRWSRDIEFPISPQSRYVCGDCAYTRWCPRGRPAIEELKESAEPILRNPDAFVEDEVPF